MRITKRIAVLLTGFALAFTAGLASPASAAPSGPEDTARAGKPTNCPSLNLCLYKNASYTGGQQNQLQRATGTCDGVLYNDTLDSVYNDTTKSVRLYNDAGCSGVSFTVTPHTGSPLMTITHANCVDETTSFKWL